MLYVQAAHALIRLRKSAGSADLCWLPIYKIQKFHECTGLNVHVKGCVKK